LPKEKSMPSLTSVFIIDPPGRLDPHTDTSLALMRESLNRDQQAFYCTLSDLRLNNEKPRARVRSVTFPPDAEMFSAGEELEIDLSTIDVLYMRKDPPVDAAYLHATYILDWLPPKVLQVNPARALRRHCEKLIPLHFPGLLPETVVTRSSRDLNDFLDRIGQIVLKPLDDCSGRGVFTLTGSDPNRRALIDQVTGGGTRFVQGQRFLPAIADGDKRVLLLAGEILGWLRRVPAAGDFRSNVNAGGRCQTCELTGAERAVCARLGEWLNREGVLLAGVDLVGEHVLEVNITSPSCLREMNELTGARLEGKIIDLVERRCRH
jgi:glutathione synthase